MDNQATETTADDLVGVANGDGAGASMIDELQARVSQLEGELAATGEALELAGKTELELRAQLAELTKANEAAARKLAKIGRGPTSAKPRRIAPMSPLSDQERVELGERIAAGESISIVFAEGKRELTGLAPIVVSGPVFNVSSTGMMLRDAVEIRSNDPAGREVTATALVMFDSDGGQLAYSELPAPLAISPGRTYRLDRAIQF